jgi:TolA-binding protein
MDDVLNFAARCAAAQNEFEEWDRNGRYEGPDCGANLRRYAAEQSWAKSQTPPLVEDTRDPLTKAEDRIRELEEKVRTLEIQLNAAQQTAPHLKNIEHRNT